MVPSNPHSGAITSLNGHLFIAHHHNPPMDPPIAQGLEAKCSTTVEDSGPNDLIRALAAIRRTQSRWLEHIDEIVQGDPNYLLALRQWREWLNLIRLHLVRAEQCLLHYLLVPEERRPWREFPFQLPGHKETYKRWDGPISSYFTSLKLETTYRRMGSIRDLDAEAVNADILTDITALAVLADTTNHALNHLGEPQAAPYLEDLAFFHVISPWKVHGSAALSDVLRWLDEFISESEDF